MITRQELANEGIRLEAIVAMAANRVIGRGGRLPWRIPADLAQFKRRTMGHPILMGRRTFESLGGILPGRRHLVLSQSMDPVEGVDILREEEDLLRLGLAGTVFVIGGAAVFARWLSLCDRLYLTRIRESYEGDVVMPEFEDDFERLQVLEERSEFDVVLYRNRFAPG